MKSPLALCLVLAVTSGLSVQAFAGTDGVPVKAEPVKQDSKNADAKPDDSVADQGQAPSTSTPQKGETADTATPVQGSEPVRKTSEPLTEKEVNELKTLQAQFDENSKNVLKLRDKRFATQREAGEKIKAENDKFKSNEKNSFAYLTWMRENVQKLQASCVTAYQKNSKVNCPGAPAPDPKVRIADRQERRRAENSTGSTAPKKDGKVPFLADPNQMTPEQLAARDAELKASHDVNLLPPDRGGEEGAGVIRGGARPTCHCNDPLVRAAQFDNDLADIKRRLLPRALDPDSDAGLTPALRRRPLTDPANDTLADLLGLNGSPGLNGASLFPQSQFANNPLAQLYSLLGNGNRGLLPNVYPAPGLAGNGLNNFGGLNSPLAQLAAGNPNLAALLGLSPASYAGNQLNPAFRAGTLFPASNYFGNAGVQPWNQGGYLAPASFAGGFNGGLTPANYNGGFSPIAGLNGANFGGGIGNVGLGFGFGGGLNLAQSLGGAPAPALLPMPQPTRTAFNNAPVTAPFINQTPVSAVGGVGVGQAPALLAPH